MDPSLRWEDGVLTFKILLSFPINRPHPEIKANAYPHVQLRFVLDARGIDQKLPRGDG